MIKAAQAVLELLHKKGYEAYFIGGKPRNDLHNKYHSDDKVDVKDVDIVTNATPEQIKKVFNRSKEQGVAFNVININFANFNFEIATYRTDDYNYKKVKSRKKIQKPKTRIAKDLNEDRARRDYTVNTVVEDINGNYIDYKYKYRNKPISAIKDIEKGILRSIGNIRLRFEEDPLRILRGFRFMSQLGYNFDKQTFKILKENLDLLEMLPHERVASEMNKLILGKYASKALLLMKRIGVFNYRVFNSILDEDKIILPGLNKLNEKDFKQLDLLNRENENSDEEITPIEAWVVLLKSLGTEKAIETLESVYVLKKYDIEKAKWLFDNYNIIDSNDIRNDLFNARTGVVLKHDISCLKELIIRLGAIYVRLYGEEYIDKTNNLMYQFCCRPYFAKQLRFTGEELSEFAGEDPGPWLDIAKEKLLYKLINSEKYPKDDEKYMELTNEAIEEALIEVTMKNEGLL